MKENLKYQNLQYWPLPAASHAYFRSPSITCGEQRVLIIFEVFRCSWTDCGPTFVFFVSGSGGDGFKWTKMRLMVSRCVMSWIDALVAVFGIYGLDFPPKGSQKRGWPRINVKFMLSMWNIDRCSRCQFWNLRGRFSPQGSPKRSWLRIHGKNMDLEMKV